MVKQLKNITFAIPLVLISLLGGCQSLNVLITGKVSDVISGKPIEGAIITTDAGELTYSDMDGFYDLYVKPGEWRMEASADGYVSFYDTIVAELETIEKDIEMYPTNVSTTTTTIDPNATTTTTSVCPSESIYGEHSEEVELLRHFRDNVLSQTPERQEIIRLYYEWSPAIAKAMEEDEEFREDVKEMVDGVLELIGG